MLWGPVDIQSEAGTSSAPRCWALALRARSMASLRGRIQASAPAKQFRSQGTARGPVGSSESQEMEVKFQSLRAN